MEYVTNLCRLFIIYVLYSKVKNKEVLTNHSLGNKQFILILLNFFTDNKVCRKFFPFGT